MDYESTSERRAGSSRRIVLDPYLTGITANHTPTRIGQYHPLRSGARVVARRYEFSPHLTRWTLARGEAILPAYCGQKGRS